MGRYLVTSGSKYQPFTYDELVKPLQQATDAYNAAQDAYDTFSAETSALGQYITDNPGDSKAKKMYDDYMLKLQTLQNNLYNNGYTASTRRELADARNAFSGMSRIGTAVKNRLERSKEYWDAKHNHPDLVMGEDPGMSGLNNYLDDELYGQNWYNYSGNAFTKEVGDDAKARADELLRDIDKRLDVVKDPRLKGYLQTIKQEGFSSKEVSDANSIVDAVLSGQVAREDISNEQPAGILAEVLLSHLDASGAKDKVSAPEWNRLVEYGKRGLAQAVGKTTVQALSDKEWDYNKQLSLERAKAAAKAKPAETPTKKVILGSTVDVESPGYKKLLERTSRQSKQFTNGPITVITPDGQSSQALNPYDVTKLVYNTESREKIRQRMGIDVALGKDKQEGKIRTADGQTFDIVTRGFSNATEAYNLGLDPKNAIAVYIKNGNKLELQPNLSKSLSEAYAEIEDNKTKIAADNNWKNIDDYTLTPKEQKKLYEDYDLPATYDWDKVFNYVTSVEKVGEYSESILSGADLSHGQYVQPALQNAFENQYNKNSKDAGKGSKYAIYKVKPGRLATEEEGVTDLSTVLGVRKNDGKPNFSSMENITTMPELLVGDRPQLRFTSENTPGEVWQVDASMFGPLVSNELNKNRAALRELMLPLIGQKEVVRMSPAEQQAKGNVIYSTLSQLAQAQQIDLTENNLYLPLRQEVDEAGNSVRVRPATLEEIMLDSEDSMMLRSLIQLLIIDPMMQDIRHQIMREHEQATGGTKDKE